MVKENFSYVKYAEVVCRIDTSFLHTSIIHSSVTFHHIGEVKMITRDYFGCDSNVFEIVTDKLNKAYKAVERGFVSFGYARAAGELARVGRYEDAKRVIMHLKDLK